MPRPASSHPTEVELQILRILWDEGPSPVRDIHARLEAEKGTNYSTTVKMLGVMLQKGLVKRNERARPHVYRPILSRSSAGKRMLGDLIDKVYDGCTSSLILQALSSGKATKDDLAEIRRLLDSMEGEITMLTTTVHELWVDRIGWLLVHSTWQFALIAVVVAIVLAAMRRAPANLRYVVLLAGWAAMVVAPLVTWLQLPESRHDSSTNAVLAPVDAADTQPRLADAIAQDSGNEPSTPAVPARAFRPRWSSWQSGISPWLEELVSAWCLGVLLFAVRPAWSWYIVQRLRRHGLSAVAPEISTGMRRACDCLRIRQPVQLWQSTRVTVPMVVGYFRPMILLPLCATSGLSTAEIEAVLAHELAHVRRHDYLVNLLQTLVETACFYHPAVWWLSSAIRREREHCCDELAANTLGSRAEYGQALLALEKLRGTGPVLSLGANSSSLLERIGRLAAAETGPQSIGVGGLLFAASLVVLITGTGIWSKIGSADQPVTTVAEEALTDARLPKGVIEGVTVDAIGRPVSGARVILRTGTARYTETDGEGKFRFEGVPPYPRQYVVWASAGNLVIPHVQVEQTVNDATNTARFTPLRLEMREGQRARFQVTSAATGEPIHRASVRFGFPDRRQAWTTKNGTAVVEGLLPQQYDVTIEAEGYARDAPKIELLPSRGTTDYKADLAPGGIVRGVVVDQQGGPIPSATVVFWQGPGSVGYYGDSPRTDGDGRFQHRFLPLGTPLEVSVRRESFLRQESEVLLSANEPELDLQFKLEPRPAGRSIAGVVRDSDGNPVVGAKVANYGSSESERREAVTNANGIFRLEDLIELRGYIVYVTADGFAPQKMSVEPRTIEQPGDVTIRLQDGHSIRGKIVDENAQPLSGVFISTQSSLYHFESGETYRTSADGVFAFDSLPADVRFSISHPDYPSLRTAIQLDGDEPVTLKLEAPGVLRGKVLDTESGEPLPQFRIQLGFSRDRQPGDRSGTYNSSWGNPGITFNSGDGHFLIKPLQAGMPLELRVMADGYQRLVVSRVVSTKQDTSELLTLSVKRFGTDQRYTLTGRLLNHAGRPAAGAQLRLIVSTEAGNARNTHPSEWSLNDKFNWVLIKSGQLANDSYCDQFLSAVTDANGQFAFTDILPDKHLQLAYWGDGVPQGRSVDFEKSGSGGTDSVTIRLPEPSVIRGTIERANFQNIGSVRLTLQNASWHTYELDLAEEQTEFAFNDLPPGEYSVVVYANPVEFTEDGNTLFRVSPLAELRVQLQPGKAEELRFTAPDVENR